MSQVRRTNEHEAEVVGSLYWILCTGYTHHRGIQQIQVFQKHPGSPLQASPRRHLQLGRVTPPGLPSMTDSRCVTHSLLGITTSLYPPNLVSLLNCLATSYAKWDLPYHKM